MRDLSLHILDLAENSVRARASLVRIGVSVDESKLIALTIADDGCGMDAELLARVMSPFGTTRTTRKVGMGIPLMAQNARLTGGDIAIESQVGTGTTFTATLHADSIDCLPLGDLAGTVVSLVTANPEGPDFLLQCSSPKGEMTFDTREVRQALGGVSLNEPEVAAWMLEAIREELEPIFGGVIL
ncbi:MAG: ATP-binding protein [Clostridia bacterium]|nr:ATP-binding protein [Clostridia bacterium]